MFTPKANWQVWCALCDRILICPVMEEDRGAKKRNLKVDAKVCCMKYLEGRMYVGLKTGTLLIYVRDKGIAYSALYCPR